MRTIDAVAWSDTLGVHPSFLPNAMRERLKRIEATAEDVRQQIRALKDAPDDELLWCLQSANRSLEQAMQALEASLRQVVR